MTWLRLAPLFLLPLLLIVPAFIPALPPIFVTSYGGLYRQWLAQRLLDIFPHDAAVSLAQWFSGASVFGEIMLTVLIVLNVAALAAWPLWVFGQMVISFYNWSERTKLTQLRSGLRRS